MVKGNKNGKQEFLDFIDHDAVGDCPGRFSGQSGRGDILSVVAEFWPVLRAGHASGPESGGSCNHIRTLHPNYYGKHHRSDYRASGLSQYPVKPGTGGLQPGPVGTAVVIPQTK